ncbi:MAG TPA: hydroxysqualene dehydroxylase HpnE [Candidatus Acidoferrales bacterium]|jgi:zeta-carotene desaturase|nr:hydroxysqualene dehydroxylase HpnE [Candidatus Acidoferrales bacterium]
MPSQSVLVIGGGLAGMSCAVALADAGFRVRLLEKRPHLGGRATSYTLPDGSEVDNCQHVTLGCCTNLADFYRRVGASESIRFYGRLYFVDRDGRRSTIQSSWLPPPLHMAPAFAMFGGLKLADKRSIAHALLAIATSGGHPAGSDGLSMLDWLHQMRQTPGAIERFWRVVLVSALDEELSRTDARYGIDVFWKAFLGNRSGYRVGIPSQPLAQLYEGCCEAITRRGGEVMLRAGIREIRLKDDRFAAAILEDGSEVYADACVAAVPHSMLLDLLPDQNSGGFAWLAGLRHLKTSPITSVHLWFETQVMTEPFLTLMDHTTQWIFNKSLLSRADETRQPAAHLTGDEICGPRSAGQYLQLVISASYDLVPRTRQEIIELCRRELADVLPATRDAKVRKATVIKEVHATFSPGPGVDRWRPAQNIGIDNLFLAGDWTRTGWPATMEGAVRSGYLAAEVVCEQFCSPQQFLQPDLPFEGLSKIWAGKHGAAEADRNVGSAQSHSLNGVGAEQFR